MIEDLMGKRASPRVMKLRDAVTSMLIDMTEYQREEVTLAATQAVEDPEAFASYVVIALGDMRDQLHQILHALVLNELITMEADDDTPRA